MTSNPASPPPVTSPEARRTSFGRPSLIIPRSTGPLAILPNTARARAHNTDGPWAYVPSFPGASLFLLCAVQLRCCVPDTPWSEGRHRLADNTASVSFGAVQSQNSCWPGLLLSLDIESPEAQNLAALIYWFGRSIISESRFVVDRTHPCWKRLAHVYRGHL